DADGGEVAEGVEAAGEFALEEVGGGGRRRGRIRCAGGGRRRWNGSVHVGVQREAYAGGAWGGERGMAMVGARGTRRRRRGTVWPRSDPARARDRAWHIHGRRGRGAGGRAGGGWCSCGSFSGGPASWGRASPAPRPCRARWSKGWGSRRPARWWSWGRARGR